MRTFEFREDTSGKFWNIELHGATFTVTYGKVGTKGRTQTKEFADAAKAQKEHDKLVKEKLAKGYVETTPVAAPAGTRLRRALEEALGDNFDDLAAHAAHADLLMEEGDSRGEFIQVQLALEDDTRSTEERKALQQREKALLKEHGREWVGALGDYFFELKKDAVDPKLASWARLFGELFEQAELEDVKDDPGVLDRRGYVFLFSRGWLTSLAVNRLTEQFATVLSQAPAARLLRRLTVRSGEDYEAPLAPFADSEWIGGLRVFQIGLEEDQCHVSGEQAVDVIARMTSLEELRLFAHTVDTAQLFALETLGNLRLLEVNHLRDYPLERLAANAALGKLTHLLIHPHALEFDQQQAYLDLPGLRAVINSRHLKGLTHLRLWLSCFGDQGCEEIVRSGILKRLKVLDLIGGTITDRGAEILAGCPDVVNLELLELSRNALTPSGVQALVSAGAKVRADNQWHYDPENPGDLYELEFLYEGDME